MSIPCLVKQKWGQYLIQMLNGYGLMHQSAFLKRHYSATQLNPRNRTLYTSERPAGSRGRAFSVTELSPPVWIIAPCRPGWSRHRRRPFPNRGRTEYEEGDFCRSCDPRCVHFRCFGQEGVEAEGTCGRDGRDHHPDGSRTVHDGSG